MDLGIKGKTGIVCAASKGLGKGCAEALADAGRCGTARGAPRTTLAIASAVTFGFVPWTAYERVSPQDPSGEESQFDPGEHVVTDRGRDVMLLGRFSLGFSHRITRWFDLNYGVSVQNAAYNIGFFNPDYRLSAPIDAGMYEVYKTAYQLR